MVMEQHLCVLLIGLQYMVYMGLYNMYTCVYGNQTSFYLGFQPPTVEEYLENID